VTKYVLEFDYRSDNGPRLVGPFDSREETYAAVPVGAGFEAEWITRPLTPPEEISQP
jgi:hypothetical protein